MTAAPIRMNRPTFSYLPVLCWRVEALRPDSRMPLVDGNPGVLFGFFQPVAVASRYAETVAALTLDQAEAMLKVLSKVVAGLRKVGENRPDPGMEITNSLLTAETKLAERLASKVEEVPVICNLLVAFGDALIARHWEAHHA